jgi:acyl-CoA thioesterase-1
MKPFSCYRRYLISLLIAGACSAVFATDAYAQAATQATRILIIGDSLSAEYGLARNTGWVEQLNLALAKAPTPITVINSSISGDTTSGGLARIDAALKQHQPTIVIVELGANDGLRGLPLTLTQKNLTEMIVRSQAIGAKIVLVGMQIPPNYGREYADGFKNMFSNIATQTRSALVPFLFEGFADKRQYFQADGIHPNELAQPLMLATVRLALDPLLR